MANPWIGSKYDSTRLLLLGESAYSWEENGEVHHPSNEHPTDQVNYVVEHFDTRFMKMLTRALTGEETPSVAQRAEVWNKVAFTNYIQDTVGEGARVRPTDVMWQNAKAAFPPLLESLMPRRILVLGKELWSNMPESDVHFSDDVQGYCLSDGSITMCWAIPHPSAAAGTSWQRIAEIIQFIHHAEFR